MRRGYQNPVIFPDEKFLTGPPWVGTGRIPNPVGERSGLF